MEGQWQARPCLPPVNTLSHVTPQGRAVPSPSGHRQANLGHIDSVFYVLDP